MGSRLLQQVTNPFFGIVTSGTLSQPTVSLGQLLRPFPQFTGVSFNQKDGGSSFYDAFRAGVKKRFSRGLSFLLSYPASKLISDTDSLKAFVGNDFSPGNQDNNNLRLERAVPPQDVPQRLVLSYVYELPFDKGKRFLNGSKLASTLAGGWTVTGIYTFPSAPPLALYNATTKYQSTGCG